MLKQIFSIDFNPYITGTQGQRTLQAPQNMQWAVRQRDQAAAGNTITSSRGGAPVTATGGGSAASGLVYIDPATIRRNTTITATVAAAATAQDNNMTMATTASQLARSFGVVIRQIADLLTMLQDYHALAPNLPRVLEVGHWIDFW